MEITIKFPNPLDRHADLSSYTFLLSNIILYSRVEFDDEKMTEIKAWFNTATETLYRLGG